MSWQTHLPRSNRDRLGQIWVWRDFPSPELSNRRDIRVWAPKSEPHHPLPVLYFQDGQNIFADGAKGDGWSAGEALEDLATHGTPAIGVAVDHGGHGRIDEYSPFVDAKHGGGRADDYLEFLTSSVKPAIDARFPTSHEAAKTGLIGSSLGGLVAFYGLFQRPEVFGLAAALSPSFWFADHAFLRWLSGQEWVSAQLYMDTGSFERGKPTTWWPWDRSSWRAAFGSRRYVRSVRGIHRRLKDMGYVDGVDLRFLIDPEGFHSETSWRRRLPAALSFLLQESTSTGAWAALA